MNIIYILLFISFVLYFIYRISTFYKKYDCLTKWIYSLITFFGILELLNVPLNILKLDIRIDIFINFIFMILIIIYTYIKCGTIKFNFEIKEKFTLKRILSVLIIFLQMFTVAYIYNENADDSYYVSLITQNVENRVLFDGNPTIGYMDNTNNLSISYMTNSFESCISYFAYVSDISVPILCHTIIPMLIIPLIYLAILFLMKNVLKVDNSNLSIIFVTFLVFSFSFFSNRSPSCFIYTRLWQGKAVFVSFMLPLLFGILSDNESPKMIVLLTVLASVFFSPIGLFLSAFLYLAYFIYYLLCFDKKNLIKLLISITSFGLIFLEIFIIRRVNLVDSNLLSISYNSNLNNNFDFYDIISTYFSYKNILFLYFISLVYVLFKGTKQSKKVFFFIPALIIILFLNPITGKIVAKYIINSDVYWRIIWLLPIEFTMIYFWLMISNRKDYTKYLVILIMLLLNVFLGKSAVFFDKENLKYNNLYKIDNCIIDDTNFLINYDNNISDYLVLVPGEPLHSTTMRQLSSKVNLFWSRNAYMIDIYDNGNEAYMIQESYSSIDLIKNNYNELITKYNIKYIIVPIDNIIYNEFLKDNNYESLYINRCDNIYKTVVN